MKISTRSWCTWLLVAGVAVTSSCKHERAPPKPGGIPIRHGFALDRAGKSMTVDFWLREGEADLSRRFMVAVELPSVYEDAATFIGKASPSVRVHVWRIGSGAIDTMNVLDVDSIYASYNKGRQWRPDVSEPMRAVVRLHAHGADGHREYVIAAGFYAPDYGHYRAMVETAFDFPVLESVPTEIVIDQFYNTGK
jgi:hypothetical protein